MKSNSLKNDGIEVANQASENAASFWTRASESSKLFLQIACAAYLRMPRSIFFIWFFY